MNDLFLPDALCIFYFEKLNFPRGEKFFSRSFYSLYVETGKTSVIHPEDKLKNRKHRGNTEHRPSAFLLISSLTRSKIVYSWLSAWATSCSL